MNKDELKHLVVIIVWGIACICMCVVAVFAIVSLPGCCSKNADGFTRCVQKSSTESIPIVEKPVCIVDTGVDYNHSFLKGKVKRAINFSNSKGSSIDRHGHGTHVAGLAVQSGAESLLSCKALNNSGKGNCSQSAKCVDWCVSRGAGVINMSLGRERPCSFTRKAIKRAVDSGVIVVTSAGNRCAKKYKGTDVYCKCSYPGLLKTTINVSSGHRQNPHSFASNLCNPKAFENGSRRRSTLPRNQWGLKSGTSMAAPVCAAKKSKGLKCGDEN